MKDNLKHIEVRIHKETRDSIWEKNIASMFWMPLTDS